MSDQEATTVRLVGAAQAGDDEAREQLFARYLPRVAWMVAARFGVPRGQLSADGEDVAQEALVRAFGALDRFEMHSPGAFAHWMEAIVLNCVRQRFRRRNATPERVLWKRYGDFDLGESFFAVDEPSPSAVLCARENDAEIEAALLGLPALYRRALIARYIAEMTYEDLAEHLGRKRDNCRKIVQRALTLLREACGR